MPWRKGISIGVLTETSLVSIIKPTRSTRLHTQKCEKRRSSSSDQISIMQSWFLLKKMCDLFVCKQWILRFRNQNGRHPTLSGTTYIRHKLRSFSLGHAQASICVLLKGISVERKYMHAHGVRLFSFIAKIDQYTRNGLGFGEFGFYFRQGLKN